MAILLIEQALPYLDALEADRMAALALSEQKAERPSDPLVRVVDVYVPAGHDGRGLPLLVDLVGFTASGLSHTNWVGFRENLPERLDRLIGEQRMSPVVVAFPDCFTRLGGNQYINSASMGAWDCEPEFSGGHRINDRRVRGDKASVAQARDGRGVLQARRAPTRAGSNGRAACPRHGHGRRP